MVRRAGFTLLEVMVAVFLGAVICLGIFSGLQTASRLSLGVAIRSEAYHLLQAEAERLTWVTFDSFASSPDETITACLRTSFVPGRETQFSYPATGAAGRVAFTRRVVDVASTGTTRTLRVEVQWTWQGRTSLISTLLYRAQ